MSWTKQNPCVPTEIGQIKHFFDDRDGTPQNLSFKFRLVVIDQESKPITPRQVWSGDEEDYLTQGQIDELINFVDARRVAFPSDLGVQYVGRIVHFLTDEDGTVPGKSIQYRVEEVDSQGQHVQWLPNNTLGDEQPFLTSGQATIMNSFMSMQRTKANGIL